MFEQRSGSKQYAFSVGLSKTKDGQDALRFYGGSSGAIDALLKKQRTSAPLCRIEGLGNKGAFSIVIDDNCSLFVNAIAVDSNFSICAALAADILEKYHNPAGKNTLGKK